MPLLILFAKIRTLYCFLINLLVRECSSVVGGAQGGWAGPIIGNQCTINGVAPARRRGHRAPCPRPALSRYLLRATQIKLYRTLYIVVIR